MVLVQIQRKEELSAITEGEFRHIGLDVLGVLKSQIDKHKKTSNKHKSK